MMARYDEVVTDRRISRQGVEDFIAEPAHLGQFYLGHYAVCHTSGSQGQPALVVQTWRDLMRGFAVQFARGNPLPKRITQLLQRFWKPVRVAVVTQQPGFYPSGAAFTYLQNAHLPFLRLLRLSVFDPVEQTVARLNAFRPQYLSGYTSLWRFWHARNAPAGCPCGGRAVWSSVPTSAKPCRRTRVLLLRRPLASTSRISIPWPSAWL